MNKKYILRVPEDCPYCRAQWERGAASGQYKVEEHGVKIATMSCGTIIICELVVDEDIGYTEERVDRR